MTSSHPTFAGFPAADLDDLRDASAVIVGAAEATPYAAGEESHSARAPEAVRAASMSFARQLYQLDFDLDAVMLPDRKEGDFRGLFDAGDVATDPGDAAGNCERIEGAVRSVLQAGGVPLVLGGDDSVPIPVARAFAGRGPLTVVHIDAHVDWGDVIKGEANGYGSPMRRVSEMEHVGGMVQLGIRGLGSGGAWQIDDARAWGSRLVSTYELHDVGVEAALSELPEGGDVFVSIDCDGIDPAVFPAVAMPTPGGLTYEDVVRVLRTVAMRGRLAGLFLGEYVPDRDDAQRLSALTAARIVSVAAGLALQGR